MPELHSPPHSPMEVDEQPAVVSHDSIPYSAVFIDSLMAAVLDSPTGQSKPLGITVLTNSSTPRTAKENAIALRDVDSSSLAIVTPSELPLPLDDPRRKYVSAVPGVLLTHPGGWLEGGEGPEPFSQYQRAHPKSSSQYSRDFITRNNIKDEKQLMRALDKATKERLEELRTCMRDRKEAISNNERIAKEINQLEAQREMERRVEEKMRKLRSQGV